MKKILFPLIFFSSALLALAAESLVAEWDFTQGQPQGKYAGRLLQQTQIKGGLMNLPPVKGKTCGYILQDIFPELAPKGGFRMEISFSTAHAGKLKNECLFDNLSGNSGMRFSLSWFARMQAYTPSFILGLGNSQKRIPGGSFNIRKTPGKIYHLNFFFNGADMTSLSVNGCQQDPRRFPVTGGLVPARTATVIGNSRDGSQPFGGKIYKIRLFSCPRPEMSLLLESDGRRAFYQTETAPEIIVKLTNRTKSEMQDVVLSGSVYPKAFKKITVNIPAGQSREFPLAVENRLRKGKYPVKLTADYRINGRKFSKQLNFDYLICSPPKDEYPIVMWGYPLPSLGYQFFQKMGFNSGIDYEYFDIFFRYPERTRYLLPSRYRMLDRMQYDDFSALANIFVNWPKFRKKYSRTGRDGRQHYEWNNLDPSHPGLWQEVQPPLIRTVRAFRDFPAYAGANVNSEQRDRSRPSFAPHNHSEYKKDTGRNIPPEVDGKLAPHYSKIKDFPILRVIPDDYPLLVYYRWFWKKGDGWNPFQSRITRTFKENIPRNTCLHFDPAIRVPPVWGSGGEVDALNHWNMAVPDPISIGTATDEQFAMARGRKGQKVMSMAQVITTRSITAPAGLPIPNEPEWAKKYPTASYITIAPDLMRIAIWTQISRQVQGIMFHGYNSLIYDENRVMWNYYQCTNTETANVVSDMLKNVVQPLAPVLKRIPERSSDIAILESFSSAIFAHRASWGTGHDGNWIFKLNLQMQHAGLQPSVIYEEELLRDKLKGIKVLVMPHCEVLTESVVKVISTFQDNGGIVVGDETLVPELMPEILISTKDRHAGAKIRQQLKGIVTPHFETTDSDIVCHVRSDNTADYLFAVNDKRTYGDYWGPYEMVREKGMPLSGKILLERPAGAVYDVRKHTGVNFTSRNGRTEIPVDFKPAEGKLFLIMPRPVAEISISAKYSSSDRGSFTFSAEAFDGQQKQIRTLLPLEITILSPDGRTDDSRPGALVNGRYEQTVIIPRNGKKGKWEIMVRDLASGLRARKYITLP